MPPAERQPAGGRSPDRAASARLFAPLPISPIVATMKEDSVTLTGAEEIRWNLDDLVSPPAAQGIETILQDCETRLDAFAARYRGAIAGLTARDMKVMLTEYENLIDLVGR